MPARTDESAEFDRLSAPLVWWGVPVANDTSGGSVDGQLICYRVFAPDLRNYGDESRCQPAAPDIWMIFLEKVAQQAKVWTELAQRVQNRCAVLAAVNRAAARKDAQANDNR